MMRRHCEEQRRFLTRHWEERSDGAISYYKHVEIATLPPVARDDNLLYKVASLEQDSQ